MTADDPHPSQALLLAWLATDDPAERQALLELHAGWVTSDFVADLLELAEGGPSYGGERETEAHFQVHLLELAEAAADRLGLAEALGTARLLLASALSELPGSEERRMGVLGEAIRLARASGRSLAVFRAERDLAGLCLALGRGREALAAYERALDAALEDLALMSEAEEALQSLVNVALATRRPGAAAGPLRRYVEAARRAGDRLLAGQAASLVGTAMLTLDMADEARPLLQEAAALLGEMADDDALARAELSLLGLALDSGDADSAARHLEAVLKLRDRVGDPLLAAEIQEQFGRFF